MPHYEFICHDCHKGFLTTLSQEDYEKHLKEVMPSAADDEFVINLEKEKGWILDPPQK